MRATSGLNLSDIDRVVFALGRFEVGNHGFPLENNPYDICSLPLFYLGRMQSQPWSAQIGRTAAAVSCQKINTKSLKLIQFQMFFA